MLEINKSNSQGSGLSVRHDQKQPGVSKSNFFGKKVESYQKGPRVISISPDTINALTGKLTDDQKEEFVEGLKQQLVEAMRNNEI